MKYQDVYTQEELLKAIEDSFIPVCRGNGEFTACGSAQVTACDNAQVTAYGSAQVTAYNSAQVTAYNSAQVTACGNAQVTACDNAQVRAYGNAQVTACDSAQVRAYGNAQVRATPYVAVTIAPNHTGKVSGGVQIKVPPVKTVDEWCEYYGVPVVDGIAILYKALDDDYSTDNARGAGITYAPGSKPLAPDWNPEPECGGGLHFSPSPVHALNFNAGAKHFCACPVSVSEIVVHYPAMYPEKVKAPRVCAPCYEVDINGNPITQTEKTEAL